MKTTTIIVLFAILALSQADLISDMLQAHNSIRRAKKIQDLTWSTDLADYAQDWAEHLAKNDLRQHSGRDGVGENLARGSAGKYSSLRLFGLWESEKEYFIEGRNYPDCSTTGDKSAVGHYTQLMWASTTQVGCGFADYEKAVLVCQYKEPGNMKGKSVYSVNGNNPGYSSTASSSSSSSSTPTTSTSTTTTPTTSSPTTTPTTSTSTSTSTPTTTFPSISWSDYKGKVDSSSDFWAYTVWNAPYTFKTSTSGNSVKATIDCECELDEYDSWYKSSYKSDELLRHENGHHQIGSIFAMTFKKQAEATTFSKSNYKKEIANLYDDLLDQFLDYEKRYDAETNHFLNKEMQKKWEADLINQVNALKAYWW